MKRDKLLICCILFVLLLAAQNLFAAGTWTQDTASDWNAGSGMNVDTTTYLGSVSISVSTFPIIAAQSKTQTTQADWNAGIMTNVDINTIPGSVTISYALNNNIALNQTATAINSVDGYRAPSMAVDGNTSSYWQQAGGYNTPGWWQVDLGMSYYIFNITLVYGGAGILRGSLDGTNWTTLSTINESGPSTATINITINGIWRYFQCNFSGSPSLINFIREFEAYARLYTAGNIITQNLDFGSTPATFSNFAADITLPTNTSITFQTSSSIDGTNWDIFTNVGIAGENGGTMNSTPYRYLQCNAILTSADGLYWCAPLENCTSKVV